MQRKEKQHIFIENYLISDKGSRVDRTSTNAIFIHEQLRMTVKERKRESKSHIYDVHGIHLTIMAQLDANYNDS